MPQPYGYSFDGSGYFTGNSPPPRATPRQSFSAWDTTPQKSMMMGKVVVAWIVISFGVSSCGPTQSMSAQEQWCAQHPEAVQLYALGVNLLTGQDNTGSYDACQNAYQNAYNNR